MADECLLQIAQELVGDCTVQGSGGNEIKGWIGNRTNFSFTFDTTNPSMVTGITALTGTQLWPVKVSRRGLNSGHDRVKETGRADRFTHFGAFTLYPFNAAEVENIDNLEDMVLIVQSKDDPDDSEGRYKGYGFKVGMEVNTDTMRANDANGSRPIEIGSGEGDTEPYSNYTVWSTDYATTAALLLSLETAAI